MSMFEFQGAEPPSFAITGCLLDDSETALSDTQPDGSRIETEDYQTWNWVEAATEVGINESTLRKVWWEEELEPAFRYSPTPLRVVTRTVKKSGREISEFTAFGLEVLKTYKAIKTKGDRAAQVFLAEARAQYPAPAMSTPSTLTESPAIRPDVLPSQNALTEGRPGGMVLHIGSTLTLPSIASLIPTADDAAYLSATQQRLQQFMAVQQQAIAEMHEGLQQAQACNTQHQEALSISDQLFLQEFQLKGVQLGYTALQLKQEAIRATIQAAEAGTLPLPGKPQPASGQVPSI